VFDQNPNPGNRIQKGDVVTILVSTGPRKVKVPRVVGKQYEEAIQILDDAGLDWRKQEVFSEKPENQVVRQAPRSGEEVAEGSTVVLRVSKGLEQVEVPDVLQQSRDSATGELQAVGFLVDVVEAPSDDTPEGLVFAQDPAPGISAVKGSTVQITVSTGPEQAEVPDVIGEDEHTAKVTLRNAGFKLDVERTDTADPTQDGKVVEQDPTGGTQADQGSTVTIVVAKFSG
jgi:serine/threonine-protein kinase